MSKYIKISAVILILFVIYAPSCVDEQANALREEAILTATKDDIRKEFETDMQAQITLSDRPELKVELPWLSEYRQLLPKSVKYRAIKLTKK